LYSIDTLCRELCRNSRINRFAIWAVDSGVLKEAQVQSYSLGGANVPSSVGTLGYNFSNYHRCHGPKFPACWVFQHSHLQVYTSDDVNV